VSLESAASEWGLISPDSDALTVMTTGCAGTYHTKYGTLEFTHTRRVLDVLARFIRGFQQTAAFRAQTHPQCRIFTA